MHTLSWTVLLLGGNSGSGKTRLARELGLQLGIPWGQLDDVRLTLQHFSSPEQAPELHYFLAGKQVWSDPPEILCEHLQKTARIVSYASEIIVANHIATEAPLILEGDGLLPAMAAQQSFADLDAEGRVRALFVIEDDEQAILSNMRERGRGIEGLTLVQQRTQAHASQLFGEWLAGEARRYGLPVVPSRPWETLLERVMELLT
jgi:2-phosphoglycerate kinase